MSSSGGEDYNDECSTESVLITELHDDITGEPHIRRSRRHRDKEGKQESKADEDEDYDTDLELDGELIFFCLKIKSVCFNIEQNIIPLRHT